MSPLTPQEQEHLVLMATCAPSVHNTQPWRFTPIDGGLLVEGDRSRQLSVIDPYGRQILMSCGAAIDHLVVAARAIGVDAVVEFEQTSDAVARLRLTRGAPATDAEVERAVAILHRHTFRGRFVGGPVTGPELNALRLAVEEQDCSLRIVRADELVEVEVVVSRAEQELLHLDGYAAELEQWVWHDRSETRGDGLPLEAVEHGPARAETLVGRQFDAVPAPRPSEPPEAESPCVVLISSQTDNQDDWVRAGRALSSLLLTATESGLVAQLFGQVMDLPGPRQSLTDLLDLVGTPQVLLRLGHGVGVPGTPRRPVADVLRPSS